VSPMLKPDPTFCALPFCEDPGALDAEVALFGAAHGTPYAPGRPSHAAAAPEALRAALGWWSAGPGQFDFDSLGPLFGGARALDCGDLPGSLTEGEANRAAIRETAGGILDAGAVPLLLGGDDSVPIPLFEALAARHERLCIVQVDAHIDWRDEVQGVRHGYSSTMRRASELPQVEAIVQIGARGPGSAREQEYRDALDWGAVIHTARDLHREGVAPALARIPEGCDIVLSIDVDGLDPSLVPGVILPAFGGLTYQQCLDVIEGAAARGRIAAAAFVEYVPAQDPSGIGAKAVARLACNVIAAVGRQREA